MLSIEYFYSLMNRIPQIYCDSSKILPMYFLYKLYILQLRKVSKSSNSQNTSNSLRNNKIIHVRTWNLVQFFYHFFCFLIGFSNRNSLQIVSFLENNFPFPYHLISNIFFTFFPSYFIRVPAHLENPGYPGKHGRKYPRIFRNHFGILISLIN